MRFCSTVEGAESEGVMLYGRRRRRRHDSTGYGRPDGVDTVVDDDAAYVRNENTSKYHGFQRDDAA